VPGGAKLERGQRGGFRPERLEFDPNQDIGP
jgi:hypothetical protein